MPAPPLSLDDYVAGVTGWDRTVLSRAITLVESARPDDEELAQGLLARLLPHTGRALRVGISGVPGVGKSTFIEAMGSKLVAAGHRVAVLAVDPSSSLSGGSILGDKSRMVELAREENAFIRPSPTAQSLGGVARRTRETMLVCEAAGCDVVLVETVGVGQSETLVAGMVDCFLVLMLPGAGDELQGIKKGILELADLIAVNKADGENVAAAREAVRVYGAALHYARTTRTSWTPRAISISARTGDGLEELWALVEEQHRTITESGELAVARHAELARWIWSLAEERLLVDFRDDPRLRSLGDGLQQEVADGGLTAREAALRLLDAHRTPR